MGESSLPFAELVRKNRSEKKNLGKRGKKKDPSPPISRSEKKSGTGNV